jgi:capsular polysaccharide biosynthesis protein
MEIRQYARILWRWLWLVLALPALVLAFTLLWPSHPATGYTASMRFSVGLTPEVRAGESYTYDRYYTWLTSEYLIDDLSEVVKSAQIAQAVAAEASRQGLKVQLPVGAIQGATSAGKLHRILTVSMSWGDAEQLGVLANATATVLSNGAAPYFQQFRDAGTPIVMQLIDPPSVAGIAPGLKSRLEVPLRLILALLAGVALAFLLEYLDNTVRDADDVRAAGLDVVGSIPRR